MDDTGTGVGAGGAVTRLGKRWKLKMAISILVLLGLGVWGYVDAAIVYPGRGARASRLLEAQYLNELMSRGQLDNLRASVQDPARELERLRAARGGGLDLKDTALLGWLDSLKSIGRLAPDHTAIPRTDFLDGKAVATAADRLTSLAGMKLDDKPLAGWDIPVQWLICAAGLVGAAYLGGLFAMVARKRYRWDAGAKRLSLPGGEAITPADLADVDRRLWHKFLVTLAIRPEHAALGGKSVTLDLYRYEPLEDWVVEMEGAAFPDRVAKDEGASQEGGAESEGFGGA